MSEFFVKDFALVQPEVNPDGSRSIIVLDRVTEGVTPEYCVHGRVTCHRCERWCWLGDNSHDVVKSGKVTPVCMECATDLFNRAKAEGVTLPRPVANVNDHRRADGPH